MIIPSEPTVTITMTMDQARRHFSALPELYTADQVAKKYQVNERYVRNEVNAGNLKGIKIAHCWHFAAADVQGWITKKRESINKATGGNADNE